MPNWCSTQFTISGDSKELNVLYQAFNDAQEKASIETSFGKTWLGHLLSFLGMSEEQIINGPVRCRGDVSYLAMDGDTLMIDTETAWAPMVQPIVMMCEKYAPNADIKFVAMEPGCSIYESNDPDVAGKYLLEIWGGEEDMPENLVQACSDFQDREKLKEILEEALGYPKGITSLIRDATAKWDNMFINLIEYVELSCLY